MRGEAGMEKVSATDVVVAAMVSGLIFAAIGANVESNHLFVASAAFACVAFVGAIWVIVQLYWSALGRP